MFFSIKRKRDEPEPVVMKIRRTETSWLIQSRRRDSGPGGPDIASSVPASSVPASLAQVPDTRDLPPLVLRKSGSSNWTFLPTVL